MSDTEYCYAPGYSVLKNKFDVRTESELERLERRFTLQRMREPAPKGKFDLAHLKAIHHHLFQDIYEWAGQIRTVEISKGGSQFQFRQYIETGMADVHNRLVKSNFLKGQDAEKFAAAAGQILGDVNYVHPFREGNGRTQLLYLKQLSNAAGHLLDLSHIDRQAWMAASREAHLGRYDDMGACIARAIAATRTRQNDDRGRGR